MACDELYKLASEYYKLKLWNDLSEDQIFGVRLTDGRIAYCSVNGYEEGDRIALAVFVGSENFDSHRNSEMHFIDISRNEEFLLTAAQDCLECIFETKDGLSDEELAEEKSFSKRNKIYFRAKNSHPRFLKFRPLCLSTIINDAEEENILIQALQAAIEVGNKLSTKLPKRIRLGYGTPFRRKFPLLTAEGESFKWTMENFPPYRYPKYPEAKFTPEDAKKLFAAKKAGIYHCEIFILPRPKEDDDGIVKFPIMLLTYDTKKKVLLNIAPTFSYITAPENLTASVTEFFLKHGTPQKIFVRNERTFIFLEKFCEQAGIELGEIEEMPGMDEEQEKILRFLEVQQMKDDGVVKDILDQIENSSVAELKKILPPDLKEMLRKVLEADILVSDLADKIAAVLKD